MVKHLDEYELAKDYLISNLNQIDESRNYTKHDSVLLANHNTIFASNRHYFENTLVPSYPGLKDLLKLWDNGRIEKDVVVQSLVLNQDSVVKFTIKSDIGTFSGTSHILIFDQNNCCEAHIDEYSEILLKRKLKDNWFYIIRKKYYAS